MTITRWILAGAVSLAGFSATPAQEPVAEWTKKLSSANYAEREKAGRALEQLGDTAIPQLEKLLTITDLETKRRAAVIIERIENRIIIDEILQATPVRLRVKNLPLHQAIFAIEKQTGLRIGSGGDKDRLIDLDAGPLPYWQVWQRFRQVAQIEESDYFRSAAKLKPMTQAMLADLMEMFNRQDNFELQQRFITPRMELASAPSGVNPTVDDRHSIRVGVKWLSVDRSVGGKAPQAVFAFELRAEPRLEIVSMPKVEITKIVDGMGHDVTITPISMLPEAHARLESADFLAAYVGEVQFGGLLHLRALAWPHPVAGLKEVHGKLRVEVASRPRMISVKNVLKAAGTEVRSKDGIVLKVVEAETTDDGDVQLTLHLDNLASLLPKTLEQQVVRVRPGFVAIRGPVDVALERLQLLDSLGASLPHAKTQYRQAKDGKGYDLDILFTAAGRETDNLTLVMTHPRREVSVVMPFVVRGVATPVEMTTKE